MAQYTATPWLFGDYIRLEQRKENARRARAAVNACEGISTEALEAGVLKKLLWALQQIITDLPARRDWLNPDVERIAREALARIEGRE